MKKLLTIAICCFGFYASAQELTSVEKLKKIGEAFQNNEYLNEVSKVGESKRYWRPGIDGLFTDIIRIRKGEKKYNPTQEELEGLKEEYDQWPLYRTLSAVMFLDQKTKATKRRLDKNKPISTKNLDFKHSLMFFTTMPFFMGQTVVHYYSTIELGKARCEDFPKKFEAFVRSSCDSVEDGKGKFYTSETELASASDEDVIALINFFSDKDVGHAIDMVYDAIEN